MNYGENEISQSLIKLGHSVVIVTGNRYFPFPNYSDTVGKILGSRIQPVGKSTVKGVTILREKVIAEFAARALFFGIQKNISDFNPDIILVSGTCTPVAVQAAYFKPQRTRLICVDSHLPSELKQGNQLLKSLFYFIFRTFFASLVSQRTDKFIAVQEATSEVIQETYGIAKLPVVISHGTDMDLFKYSQSERKKVRKKLRIPQNAFVIITTGKIIPAKGVDLLFEAVKLLLKVHSDIYLLVVGDGPIEYKKKCLRVIPVLKRLKIHMVGFQLQKSLPKFYSSADIAVWPLQESLAMNDAISCGIPVIANDNIGVKERFSNGNALLYKQGNVIDLVEKIEYLYEDRDLRMKMGKRGRALVERKMSWKRKAKKYIQ
ncbi:MAG: glycosyltransferase family 4 protein [Candidatus Woesebacteria bacterium]